MYNRWNIKLIELMINQINTFGESTPSIQNIESWVNNYNISTEEREKLLTGLINENSTENLNPENLHKIFNACERSFKEKQNQIVNFLMYNT